MTTNDVVSSLRTVFHVTNQFDLDDQITLYLERSITVTLDLDISWCRIHQNWNLLRSFDMKGMKAKDIVNSIIGAIPLAIYSPIR